MRVIDLDYQARTRGFQEWVENRLQTEVCTAATFRYRNEIGAFIDRYMALMNPRERALESANEYRDFELAPFIYSGIYKKHAFEACSTVQNGFEYIGLSSGAVIQLINLYRTLLASAVFLDGYGNSSQEINEMKKLKQSLLPQARATSFLKPACPQREQLAFTLATTALTFIWSHEDEHLLLGHDLLHAAASGRGEYLFPSLELAADRRALHHSRKVFSNFAAVSSPLNQFRPAQQEAIWLSTLVLMFLWLDVRPHTSPSHPSPHLRLANLAHHFVHDGNDFESRREALFNQITKHCLSLWQALAMRRHTIAKLPLQDAMNNVWILHNIEHLHSERIQQARSARQAERKQRAEAILARQLGSGFPSTTD
ncbi:hypothetical protein Q9252_15395 [Marinobacter salarius]|uniref:hypothetical protein n=1 Tax=Marinobacter salarius TaxID=1420917 RepID=UPI00273BFD26|nr:hypothetical protein [Marinobacter salarius]MDP4533529.1 hypothetical protein [Marinobacter salarius]